VLLRDVIGQSEIKKKLIQSVSERRISHAQFFLGREGTGALPTALSFAQYVMCDNKSDDDSCGKCSSCVKHSKFIHPDLHFTFPFKYEKEAGKLCQDYLPQWRSILLKNPYFGLSDWFDHIKSENKQINITADECYEIVRKLNLKTFESEFKIFLIWMPEYLGKEGNSLLKSLEEPPANTLFILVGESEEKVLNTIISRTQLLRFHTLTDEEIIQALTNNKNLTEEEARRVARLSDGSYTQALSEISHTSEAIESLMLEWFRLSLKADIKLLNKWLEQFVELGRERQKLFLKQTLKFIRETLIAKNLGESYTRVRDADVNLLRWLAANLSYDAAEELSFMLDSIYYYIERNANPRIQLRYASLTLHRLINNKNIFLEQRMA
jgi:DNA polymerase-3 subunit delta'